MEVHHDREGLLRGKGGEGDSYRELETLFAVSSVKARWEEAGEELDGEEVLGTFGAWGEFEVRWYEMR